MFKRHTTQKRIIADVITLYPCSVILNPVYISSEWETAATPPKGCKALRRYTPQEPTQTAALNLSWFTYSRGKFAEMHPGRNAGHLRTIVQNRQLLLRNDSYIQAVGKLQFLPWTVSRCNRHQIYLPQTFLLQLSGLPSSPEPFGRKIPGLHRLPSRSTSVPCGIGSTAGFARCLWRRHGPSTGRSPSGSPFGDKNPRRKWRLPLLKSEQKRVEGFPPFSGTDGPVVPYLVEKGDTRAGFRVLKIQKRARHSMPS